MAKEKNRIRERFKKDVFERDRYSCKWCGKKYAPATADEFLDAHHITDRNEMPNGGYVKENGISLCKHAASPAELSCHMKAEQFHISAGTRWEPGMHPEDLYRLIASDKTRALQKSEQLSAH